MKLLVGLGNPGASYSNNRHNIGFRVIDFLFENFTFPQWNSSNIFQSSKGWIVDEQVVLIKPNTFMNHSGNAVFKASKFFKIECKDIFVFHDDLNLGWGLLKKKHGGGHGGHNGLRSISDLVGEKYSRVRIGIGRPDEKKSVANYVLSAFTSEEEIQIRNILNFFISNISNIIEDNSFLIDGIIINSEISS